MLTVSFGYPRPDHPGRMLFTHEQAKALLRAGAEVDALDFDPPDASSDRPSRGDPSVELYDGVSVARAPLPRSFRAAPGAALRSVVERRGWLRRRVQARRYDLVLLSFLEHKHTLFWDAFRAAGAGLAVTVHGADALKGPPHAEVLKSRMLRSVDRILCVSRETADVVLERLPGAANDRVRVIENGIDREKLDRVAHVSTAQARARLGWPRDRPIVLSVGNLVRRKGLDRLLAADALLVDRGHRFLHVIVGRGPERARLGAQVRASGLEGTVRFVDEPLDDRDLATAYVACTVFALASRTLARAPAMEGFGVVYAEAGYVGRPVVAGASGGVPSVVVHDVTGRLVDPEGPDAAHRFADALEQLLTDPAEAKRLGASARAHVRARFDWDLNARRVLEATEDIAAR